MNRLLVIMCLAVAAACTVFAQAPPPTAALGEAETVAQTTASIKVVSAYRTRLLDLGDRTIVAEQPEKNVLLALRIEGISLAEYEAASKDRVVLQADEGTYTPTFRMSAGQTTFVKDGQRRVVSPWIVITFSVPKETVNMKLVVGNHPPVAFKPQAGVRERLSDTDL